MIYSVELSALLLILLLLPCNSYVSRHHDDRSWAGLVYFFTAPGCVVFLGFAAILSIPYFFVFPERHMTFRDVHGSPAQKKALQQYRISCAERGVFRRILERLRIVRDTGRGWPEILADDQATTRDDWPATNSICW